MCLSNFASENDFLRDKQDRVICSIATKGAGKTFGLLQYISYCLVNDIFDEYHLVLPSFLDERDGSYDFLKPFKQITIYVEYSPAVSEAVLKRSNGERRILYAIDDSTNYSVEIKTDLDFLSIATRSRHLRITLYVVAHGCKKILEGVFRDNIDYLFLLRNPNRRIVDAVYEEYFSMKLNAFSTEKEFRAFFNTYVNEVEHGCLFVNNLTAMFNPFVKMMAFMNVEYEYNKKTKRLEIKQQTSVAMPNHIEIQRFSNSETTIQETTIKENTTEKIHPSWR